MKKKVLCFYIAINVALIILTSILMSGCIAVGTRLTINGIPGYIDAIQNTGPEVIMEVYPSGSFELSAAYAIRYIDNTLEVLYCWLGEKSTYRSHVWVEKLEDRDRYWGESTLPIGEFALVGDENKEKPIQNITCGGFWGVNTLIWSNRGTKAPSDQLYYQIAGRKFVPGNPPTNKNKPQPAPAIIPEKGFTALNQMVQKPPKVSKIAGNTVFFEGGESLILFGQNLKQLKQYLTQKEGKLGKLLSKWGNIKNKN